MVRTIKYFLRYIKTFNKLTHQPSIIVPRDELPWEKGDAADLSTFFESGTGKRFVKILQNIEAENNARAVIEKDDRIYNAGSAFGSRCMLAHVFSLSATDPEPSQQDEYESLRDETELDELENLMSQYVRQ